MTDNHTQNENNPIQWEEQQEDQFLPDLLTLEDEEGLEHTFEILDAAEINDIHYLALVPYDENPSQNLSEDDEMIIMRLSEQNGEEVLDVVEDEEELMTAWQVFLDRLSEMYTLAKREEQESLQNELEENPDKE